MSPNENMPVNYGELVAYIKDGCLYLSRCSDYATTITQVFDKNDTEKIKQVFEYERTSDE